MFWLRSQMLSFCNVLRVKSGTTRKCSRKSFSRVRFSDREELLFRNRRRWHWLKIFLLSISFLSETSNMRFDFVTTFDFLSGARLLKDEDDRVEDSNFFQIFVDSFSWHLTNWNWLRVEFVGRFIYFQDFSASSARRRSSNEERQLTLIAPEIENSMKQVSDNGWGKSLWLSLSFQFAAVSLN